jgi:integrase
LIRAMPRPRPPHLHRERSRHGKIVWYVRVGKGPRVRLRAAFGTPEFEAEYKAAVAGEPAPGTPARVLPTSLQWLWDSYRQTSDWLSLAPATRKQRENIMLHILKESGTQPYAAIKKAHVAAGIDRRAKTPSAARNFLDTLKGLFRWAREREFVKEDPTANVKPPKRRKTGGFPPWTREDVQAYQRRWPLGTRQRVWLDVILYTGPRRGDAAVIGKQHVKDVRNPDGTISKVAQFRTEKSGRTVTVTIPILPVLQRTLEAGPTGDLAWICGARGRPFAKESFGNEFSAAARAAGIMKSAHGVRKIAATIAAENGATAHQLMAIFGWTNIRQAEVYTREAERARLAAQAISTLDETGTSIPAPSDEVRAIGEKE